MQGSIFPTQMDQTKRQYSSITEIKEKQPHILTGEEVNANGSFKQKMMMIEDGPRSSELAVFDPNQPGRELQNAGKKAVIFLKFV